MLIKMSYSVGVMRSYILSRSHYLHTKTKLWVYTVTFIHTLCELTKVLAFLQWHRCVYLVSRKSPRLNMFGRIWASTLSALSSRRHTCSKELSVRRSSEFRFVYLFYMCLFVNKIESWPLPSRSCTVFLSVEIQCSFWKSMKESYSISKGKNLVVWESIRIQLVSFYRNRSQQRSKCVYM